MREHNSSAADESAFGATNVVGGRGVASSLTDAGLGYENRKAYAGYEESIAMPFSFDCVPKRIEDPEDCLRP